MLAAIGAQLRGQEAGDAGAVAELAREARPGHVQRDLSLSGEQLQCGAREDFERHHGGRGIARQSEEEALLSASEDDGLAGLNEHAIEEELGAEFGKNGLHHIVLAGGDAARKQQQVAAQAEFDHFGGVIEGVARNGQKLGRAAGANHLRGQRVGIGVADLKILGRFVEGNDLIARGEDGHGGLRENGDAAEAERGQHGDAGVIEPRAGAEDQFPFRRFARFRIDELAGLHAAGNHDALAAARDVFHHDDGVGAHRARRRRS